MIVASELRNLVDAKTEGTPHYVVDLVVHPGNKIVVELDGDQGASIEDCMKISRYLEHDVLDRDVEDFELHVTTPGLDKPFKVHRQYVKNVGRNVKVRREEGLGKLEGLLKAVTEEQIVLETREKVRVEGRKKKEWVVTEHVIPFADIIETKVVISFK